MMNDQTHPEIFPTHSESPAQLLARLWDSGQKPDIHRIIAAQPGLSLTALAEALAVDQWRRWNAGERVPTEDYLSRYPALESEPEQELELIYGEFLVRQELGESPEPSEYFARFPRHAEQLRRQLEVSPLLNPSRTVSTLRGSGRNRTGSLSASAPLPPPVPGYEILGELGRGGMGVVYKARQTSLNRLVALKMILAGGHAGPEALARFRGEAEAVARLQHPNVVQIYEIGEHNGRPYFALEYVEGGSLDRYLGGAPQPARDAAALVETLARAVHYAHQRGIVHRDLKPANILLQMAEGKLQIANLQSVIPKIADFGLAKHLAGENDPLTHSGQILGTPEYMAPEQAGGGSRRVGPAADVYALGVILYQLLTGRPPFKGETLEETLLQLLTADPVPPSGLRLKTPRDLDTITLKCLAKEPQRRYASALELAEDLGRFRRGEVIRARPVALRERLWRWSRRNPVVASLLAVLVLVVAGALGTITGLWLRADRLRQVAEGEKADARAKLTLAQEATEQYATRVSDDLQLREEDLRPLRKQLLADVAPFYEKLVEGHSDDPQLQIARARAYVRLAKLTSEIDDNEKALAFHDKARAILEELLQRHPQESLAQKTLAESSLALGELHSAASRAPQAEASFTKAIDLFQQLRTTDPEDAVHDRDIARAHSLLGFHYGKARQEDRADGELREAVRILDEQVRANRGGDQSWQALAESYNRLGAHHIDTREWAAAESALVKALALFEEFNKEWSDNVALRTGLEDEWAGALRNLCMIYLETERAPKAEPHLEKLIALRERIAQRHLTVTHYQSELAKAYNTLGTLHLKAGRPVQAEPYFAKAIPIHERLTKLHRKATIFAQELAGFYLNRGSALDADGKDEASLVWFARAADTFEEVLRREPENRQAKRLAWYPHRKSGEALTSLGRYEDAAKELDRAHALSEGPDRISMTQAVAEAQNNLGVVWLGKKRLPEAEAAFRRALTEAERLLSEKPGEVAPELLAAACHANLGIVHFRALDLVASEADHQKSLKIKERLAEQNPKSPELRFGLALGHNNVCVLYGDLRRFDQAVAASTKAVALLEALVAKDRDNLQYKSYLGGAYTNRGIRSRESERPLTEQIEWFTKAIQTLEPLTGKVRNHPGASEHLHNAYWERATIYGQQGRHVKAIADWDKAILLDTGSQKDQFRLSRAGDLARLGDHVRATEEADALARTPSLDAEALYELSRIHALSVSGVRKDDNLTPAERDERIRHGLRRGVELLERACDAGYFKSGVEIEGLKTDQEFAPLQENAEFAQVLRELEMGKPKDR